MLTPRENPDLLGHTSAERELRRLAEAGRLPHAILLSGPRGIGKATLAFRFARFLFAVGSAGDDGLAADPESSVFRRVASGGHADLLTVERAYDPRRRRLRSDILVEDTRAIAGFFRLTSAEEGWRVVIVDGAEEMNRNAANALLKILEEPPRRADAARARPPHGRGAPGFPAARARLALRRSLPLTLPLTRVPRSPRSRGEGRGEGLS